MTPNQSMKPMIKIIVITPLKIRPVVYSPDLLYLLIIRKRLVPSNIIAANILKTGGTFKFSILSLNIKILNAININMLTIHYPPSFLIKGGKRASLCQIILLL